MHPTIGTPVDGSCVRCGQNIPPWLTFTLGRGGRVFCSEYCQRLDEQSRDVSEALREVAQAAASDDAGDEDAGGGGRDARTSRRLRFLSRLR